MLLRGRFLFLTCLLLAISAACGILSPATGQSVLATAACDDIGSTAAVPSPSFEATLRIKINELVAFQRTGLTAANEGDVYRLTPAGNPALFAAVANELTDGVGDVIWCIGQIDNTTGTFSDTWDHGLEGATIGHFAFTIEEVYIGIPDQDGQMSFRLRWRMDVMSTGPPIATAARSWTTLKDRFRP